MSKPSESDVKMPESKATFAEFHEAGCVRVGGDSQPDMRKAEKQFGGMFATLTRFGHGNICNGCPHVGKCAAFRVMNPALPPIEQDAHAANNSPNYPGMSVRQIAEKLNVSMSEVRRRKLAGTL